MLSIFTSLSTGGTVGSGVAVGFGVGVAGVSFTTTLTTAFLLYLLLFAVAFVAMEYTEISHSPAFFAVTFPLFIPTDAIDLSDEKNLTTSVDVSGVFVALIFAVLPIYSSIFSSSTESFVARCNTLNVFTATAFPDLTSFAVILTVPGVSGFSFPVDTPIVATFLLLE